MSKYDYHMGMAASAYFTIACLSSAIYGLIYPNTTTPWFWFAGTVISIATGMYKWLKYHNT
jgi:hypothetical protein